MTVFILLLIILIIMIVLFLTRNSHYYWKKRGVEQITPFLFFGNFFDYIFGRKSPGDIIKDFYHDYKNYPYVGIYTIMDTPCLLLTDPKIIKSILVTNFLEFSDKFMKSSAKDPLSNRSLPFLPHSKWSNLRKKLSPAFSPTKLKADFSYLRQVTDDLDAHLRALNLESGKTIDMKEICAKYTTDIIGLIGFGLNLNSLKNPQAEFRSYGKMMFGDFTSRRSYELTAIYLAPSYIKNFLDCRFFEKKSGEFFQKEFERIIENRERSEVRRNDLLDILIQIKRDDNLELNDIIAQAIVLFTAGFDTTSSLMSFTLFELASNIKVQEKLRAEIKECLEKNNGTVTFEMVTTLPFLENVINETLRLHPTVPTIDRISTKDFTIPETGLRIEKGTPIMISLTGLHSDRRYFKNPEIFDPENFEKSGGSKSPAYMPFGIGPRSCIALRQGLIHVKFGIIYLISNYRVNLSTKNLVEVDPRVYFTSGKGGLNLHITKIESNVN